MRSEADISGKGRKVLFLQGPHGPFFNRLAAALRRTGAQCLRVGFNRGDGFFWSGGGYVPYDGRPEDWPAACAELFDSHEITDLVIYGDTRPIHSCAVALARARGITVHVFEEGYLRPYWLTYERGGSNGHSRLMDLSVAQMRASLARPGAEQPKAPARWGDMREHMFYGAAYHLLVMVANRRYPHFQSHRDISLGQEFRLYLRRFLSVPLHRVERRLASLRVRLGGFPFHLVLLQLEHDASFRAHSDLPSMATFVDLCLDEFARGAPTHHHLVFKAHPLEDGRVPLPRLIREGAARRGLAARVHFIRGGKLAGLLRDAVSAVTVNSTAAQQALWRGLPVRIFGRAVYDKPELVSNQPLAEFFARPRAPDMAAYHDFRQFLLESSQIPGGFYSTAGRRRALRFLVDRMLDRRDPYDFLLNPSAAQVQHLRLVK